NFSIIAPALTELGTLGGIRFGLQDESARLNINALPILEENSGAISSLSVLSGGSIDPSGILDSSADPDAVDTDNIAVTLLMTLPGMDESIADAILDFLDEDSEVRPMGCEDEYYGSLPSPYLAANGPLQSVEELLLVRGVTPDLLFGADSNRNGVIDTDEQQRFTATTDTPGAFGWASYLTVHGVEVNKSSDGLFRVNVNQDDLEVLYEELQATGMDPNWASFIVAYRIAGTSSLGTSVTAITGAPNEDAEANTSSRPPQLWTVDALDQFDLTGGADIQFNQILDLVDAQVTAGNGDNATSYLSPFINEPEVLAEMLPQVMDLLTTQDNDLLPGRINLNECPAELLYGLTVVDADTVAAVLEARSQSGSVSILGGDTGDRTHETWPLTEGLVTLDQMRALLPLVNAGGDVFRAQVVGYDPSTGLFCRAEAIVDATTLNPRLVQYRDLSHLGRGFDLSLLGSRTAVDVSAN
ncbi:MAG: type II secretion system protein GspK, partial [Planctomycetota bacterium]